MEGCGGLYIDGTDGFIFQLVRILDGANSAREFRTIHETTRNTRRIPGIPLEYRLHAALSVGFPPQGGNPNRVENLKPVEQLDNMRPQNSPYIQTDWN
jgi:hypothetical protein